jgi:hypothetical protein
MALSCRTASCETCQLACEALAFEARRAGRVDRYQCSTRPKWMYDIGRNRCMNATVLRIRRAPKRVVQMDEAVLSDARLIQQLDVRLRRVRSRSRHTSATDFPLSAPTQRSAL